MRWYQNPYVLWLIFSAVVSALLALFAWTRRAQPGVRAFSLLVTATGFWAFAYALEFVADPLWLKLVFARLQYLGIAAIPSLSFLFAVTYLHLHDDWLTARIRWALVAVPLIWNVLVWMNEYHHLNWTSIQVTTLGGITILDFDYGLVFWVAAGYSYLLLAIAATLLFREVRRGRSLRRKQGFTLFMGILLPWIGNWLYLVGLTPLPQLDLTPFAYALSNIILAWGLFQQQILDVIPIARDVVVEGMEDAVFVLDEEMHIVDYNPAAHRLLFKDRKKTVLGCPVTEVFAEREELLSYIWTEPNVVNRIAWENEGDTDFFDLRVSHLFNDQGASVGRVVVLRDVTAQGLVEEALRESEAHLRAQNAKLRKLTQAVEHSGSSIVITDLGGRIEYVNPKFEKVTGYTAKEVLGKSMHILKSGEHSKAYYADLWNTITEGEVWRGQFHNRRKDCTLYWERLTISPVYNSIGRKTNFIGIGEDITDQKEAEAALHSFTERLQILHELDGYLLTMRSPEKMASAACARLKRLIPCERIYVLERESDGEVTLVAAESTHGLPLPEHAGYCETVMGFAGLQAGHPVGCPDMRALSDVSPCQQHLYEEGIRSYVVVPLITRNELVGTLHLEAIQPQAFTEEHVTMASEAAALLAVAVRQVRLYTLAQQEIAERRQAETQLREYTEELEASNAELDAFAHTVAHDLKSPLGTLVGFSEFLMDTHRDLPDKELKENLAYMAQSGWRMTSIVEELLLLASVRRQQEVELAPLETATLIDDAWQRLASMVNEHDAILKRPDMWPVAWSYDPWVEEVWVNYLSNAIKYGGEPPVIQVGADVLDNGYVRFWVQDNGSGLTQVEQATLFTEFTRLDELKTKGHGLGLSIVRRIVERLGGEVGVKSVVGVGSRFYFTLPGSEQAVDVD